MRKVSLRFAAVILMFSGVSDAPRSFPNVFIIREKQARPTGAN